jgi:hypothetical protein
MTHLQQALAERRAARNASEDYLVLLNGTAPVVTVHLAAGEAWSFPWASLVCVWHDPSEGREKIVLTFPQHVVCVEGRNLDRIMPEIGEMRLYAVREHDKSRDYKGHVKPGHTVVAKITVTRVDDLPLMVENSTDPAA